MSAVLDVFAVVMYCGVALCLLAAAVVALDWLWGRLLDRPVDEGERAAVVSLDSWRRGHVRATPMREPGQR